MFSTIFWSIICFLIAVPLILIIISLIYRAYKIIVFIAQIFTEAITETGKEYAKHYKASSPAVKVFAIIMLGVVLLGLYNTLLG